MRRSSPPHRAGGARGPRRGIAACRTGAGLLAALALLAGCSREPPIHQQQAYVFGTLVEITIAGEPEDRAKRLAGQVLADFDQLHHSLHAWKPGSLSRVNAILAQSPARGTVPPMLIPVIADATRLSKLSGGLFNPAIGRLVALWGFHADEFQPRRPDPAEIARLVAAKPSMEDVTVEGLEVWSRNPAVRLDFGGYAKGYALDLAAAYLRGQGVKSALVNIGGNILALGQRGDRPWRVGIQHPRAPGPMAVLELRDGEAIGTSGDYQRYFELDGRRYCHLIDPRTGYPVEGVQAATVVAGPGPGAGALSDAASKPVFIAGRGGWREAARAMGVELALLVDGEGVVHATRALAARLQPAGAELRLQPVP